MNIRKAIASVVAAAVELTMTACATNETPNGNSGGAAQPGGNSVGGDISVLDTGDNATLPEPTGGVGIWGVLPEIPVTDASAFKYEYDSDFGGMSVTDYLGASPNVRIPDTLDGKPVVKVDLNACEKELTEVIFPDTVKWFDFFRAGSIQYINYPRDLEDAKFEGWQLKAAYIADGVTKINDFAFCECKSLTRVNIPDSVTEIGTYAFSGCASLANVTIPDSVTQIGTNAFFVTPWLENKQQENRFVVVNNILIDGATCSGDVTIPDGIPTIGDGTFVNCKSLTSVTIPDGVTKIGNDAFGYCPELTSVTIPDGVTAIGEEAFCHCENLASITIPNSVTEIGLSAFLGCESLTSITIPDSVTVISNALFLDCTGLTSVIIPDTVTEIGYNAFGGCTSLASIAIPDSVSKIGNKAFNECTSLASAAYKGKTYDYEHIEDLYTAINGN